MPIWEVHRSKASQNMPIGRIRTKQTVGGGGGGEGDNDLKLKLKKKVWKNLFWREPNYTKQIRALSTKTFSKVTRKD